MRLKVVLCANLFLTQSKNKTAHNLWCPGFHFTGQTSTRSHLMPTGPHASNLIVFETGTQSFQLHYSSNTSSFVFLSISLAYTTVFTAKQNKFRNSHIFILIINYIFFQEHHLKYHWKSFSHLSKAPVNLFPFYVVLDYLLFIFYMEQALTSY